MFWSIVLLSIAAFIFCLLVLPFWVYMHYKSKRQMGAGLSMEDKAKIHQLNEQAKALRRRVEQLEAILDYQQPQWRQANKPQ
ncbi:envelope stress response membrane protein PspB [Testudinibacter sp. P80/BLE/0925]|uniref:envelope stress response membrane protein PspB n=1 Tax=Testudinibacter sp. TW-1 TaxID=3417757 RepID=UPI003D35E5CB